MRLVIARANDDRVADAGLGEFRMPTNQMENPYEVANISPPGLRVKCPLTLVTRGPSTVTAHTLTSDQPV